MEQPKTCRCGSCPEDKITPIKGGYIFDCGSAFVYRKNMWRWDITTECRRKLKAKLDDEKKSKKQAMINNSSVVDIFTGLEI